MTRVVAIESDLHGIPHVLHRESYDKERSKLIMQAQQLSVDLEQVREQVALKNRDNLRLQENILGMEEKVREAEDELQKARESLKVEMETRERLDLRLVDLLADGEIQ